MFSVFKYLLNLSTLASPLHTLPNFCTLNIYVTGLVNCKLVTIDDVFNECLLGTSFCGKSCTYLVNRVFSEIGIVTMV